MSDMEILVARHGQTNWNRDRKWQGLSDIPLNEVGIAQARKLGESLRDESVSRIFSSDLRRAMKTADIVSRMLDVSYVMTDRRLRERSLGIFEGWQSLAVAHFAGIPEDEYQVLETDELRIDGLPHVELWSDFRNRIWTAFVDIARKSDGEKTLIIAHGGVMRAISVSITNDESNFAKFSNCQFMRITKDAGNWRIK